MNWLIFALGAGIGLIVVAAIHPLGVFRWWRRRHGLLQLLLMLFFPALIAAMLLPTLWMFELRLDISISVFVGLIVPILAALLWHSYLIQQIIVAFSDPEVPDETTKE